MSLIKNLFKKRENNDKKTIENEKPMSATEVSRELELMGVTINAYNGGVKNMKMGGNAPSKQALEAYNLGTQLVSKEKYAQAIEMFKKAVELSPNFTDAHYNLAKNYERIRSFEQAKREYEIVLGLREFDADALNNLGVLYAMEGRLEKAKELFDKVLKYSPDDALAHRNLAAYFKEKGNMEMMNKYAHRAQELDKDIFNK